GAPKEIEANPMLGMHGIRFSVKNPEILKAELKALQRVSQQKVKIGLLLPQVISVGEVKQVKQFLREINFSNAKLGVMVETPASVQIISDLCEEKINFISFGTNDLTQYILAIDRGNEQVQHLYDEMHPAVLRQLDYVIRVCKKYKVETSICGQAGSKKEMVKFLVEKGIDSISVNADVAKEISDYVKKIEDENLGKKGELPRKYQPSDFARLSPEGKFEKSERGLEPNQEKKNTQLEQDIKDIEAEKQEYLKKHPEEK
ncbi:MAG: putative PEP-binding protein, partial [Nanoarchaeota archaeon]